MNASRERVHAELLLSDIEDLDLGLRHTTAVARFDVGLVLDVTRALPRTCPSTWHARTVSSWRARTVPPPGLLARYTDGVIEAHSTRANRPLDVAPLAARRTAHSTARTVGCSTSESQRPNFTLLPINATMHATFPAQRARAHARAARLCGREALTSAHRGFFWEHEHSVFFKKKRKKVFRVTYK